MADVKDVRDLRKLEEEELVLLEELQRRGQDDPLRLFQPHPKQKEFIDAVLSKAGQECWFFAANRAGKTDAGAYAGATLARYGDQGPDVKWVSSSSGAVSIRDRATSGWVSGLDFPTLRDVVQPKYFDNGFVPPGAAHMPFIPAREVQEWRVSDQILRLKNGSIVGFKSVDSGPSKYQGAEKDWVHLDEEHPQPIYNEISIRVGQRRLRIFGTATILPPVGQVGGVSWMFEAVIKPALKGILPDFRLFNASIYDNPHIPENEIRKLEAKYPEGTIERRIRLNGELLPGLSGSRAYAAFEERLHVRPQPAIVMRRPLCIVLDFNVEPMISLVGQRERTQSGKILFRVYKEIVIETDASPDASAELFRQYHPNHSAEIWIYGDATGKHRGQTGKSSYSLFLNSMQSYNVPIKLRVPDSNPIVSDRLNAVNNALRDEDSEIRVEIDPSCIELIADLEQVKRDPKGGIKKIYDTKDSYSKRTHASDCLGYWIIYDDPVQQLTRDGTPTGAKIKAPSYGFGQARQREAG